MKMKVLYLIAVLALAGPARGDATGGDLGAHTAAGSDLGAQTAAGGDLGAHTAAGGDLDAHTATGGGCPHGDDRPSKDVFYERVEDCFMEVIAPRVRQIRQGNGTTEEMRSAYKTFCGNLETLRQCLDGTTTEANACFNETERTKFNLHRNLKIALFAVGCSDEGVRLASLEEEMDRHRNEHPDKRSFLDGCRVHATSHVEHPHHDDPNGDMVFEFKVMNVTRECLAAHHGHGQDVMVNIAMTMSAEMMDIMKCVHPEEGNEVLCKTILNEN